MTIHAAAKKKGSRSVASLVEACIAVVGKSAVLTEPARTRKYRTGFRYGGGGADAVILPGSLLELWQVLELCVAADAIVIMQAANTGLTGGSTPDGDHYDRSVVVINPMRIAVIHVIEGGKQVVCLPGATLHGLERALEPLGREPHSVIGSSCFGASVVGGVCNNSGGSMLQRGPAYTELALFARRTEEGRLELVNHLGIELGDTPVEMLGILQTGHFSERAIAVDGNRSASDAHYIDRVREIDAATPARYNADPDRLYEASGCAGKMAVLAVRLDTFPKPKGSAVFYIGTNDVQDLTHLRRHMLRHAKSLPVAAEYMNRACFDIADRYGKDMFLAIRLLGTRRLPTLFSWKSRVDEVAFRLGFGAGVTDRLMYHIGRLMPDHLPPRFREFRDRFEHHLLLKMDPEGVEEAANFLSSMPEAGAAAFFLCQEDEGDKAFLHRFVTAGAAVRYRLVHSAEVEDIVALDVALPRNSTEWEEKLPPDLSSQAVRVLYYGHFFCHVFHQDYILRKGCDPTAFEHAMWKELDRRGAKYPAEHNVGHLYPAEPGLAAFYQRLDPTNSFNPGIGQTSKHRNWSAG